MRGIVLHAATERRRRPDGPDPFLVDVHTLAEQVAVIAARARVLSLEEVLDHLAEGRPPPPHAVHLSIDGGFAGTLAAAELLARHGLPWTLFVIVDSVLDGRSPWFVRLADAVEATTNVLDPRGAVHDLSDRSGKRAFLDLARAAVRSRPGADPDAVTDWILRWPGMAPSVETRWPFLRVPELRELEAAGVSIGSHSATHADLTRVGDARLHAEVSASGRLARALGRPVRFFAYPHGRHDARVRRAVAAEHDLGLGMATDWSTPARYSLGRRDAGDTRRAADVALGHDTPPRQARLGVVPRALRAVQGRQLTRRWDGLADPSGSVH